MSTKLKYSDLSRSYPFLDLSRRMEVEYAKVLQIADQLDWVREENINRVGIKINLEKRMSLLCEKHAVAEWQVRAVADVCAVPWRWEFPPLLLRKHFRRC